MLRWPGLRHQRGTARPLPSHSQPEENSKDSELEHRLRQPTCARKNRVDQNAQHERLRPTYAIGQDAEDNASHRGREQRERSE